jgi:hypothetical protein
MKLPGPCSREVEGEVPKNIEELMKGATAIGSTEIEVEEEEDEEEEAEEAEELEEGEAEAEGEAEGDEEEAEEGPHETEHSL